MNLNLQSQEQSIVDPGQTFTALDQTPLCVLTLQQLIPSGFFTGKFKPVIKKAMVELEGKIQVYVLVYEM